MTLAEVESGKKVKVVEICGGCGVKFKLNALGIREGVQIEKMSEPFMKGPVVIKIGNTKVAIGFGMAKKILVEKV